VAKGEDALSAGAGITAVQAVLPADSRSGEVGHGDVAAIRGGDLDLREPDAQVQVPGWALPPCWNRSMTWSSTGKQLQDRARG